MSKQVLISYDHAGMQADPVVVVARLSAARQMLLATPPPFFELPTERELAAIRRLAAATARKFRTLIVVGIGGSDLGARTLVSALPVRRGMAIRFIGANTDPDEIAALLAEVDLKTCALNIVSKSGGTIEPMATFLLLRQKLIAAVGKKKHAAHIIATTDPVQGALHDLAGREGYARLAIPPAIGGRFCVFTPAGLFPAACAGIDLRRLTGAAAALQTEFQGGQGAKSLAPLLAGLFHEHLEKYGRDLTVLMPYAARLKELAFWFRQLWAESLGKRLDRRGRIVHRGLTPIAALGATDQHSQIQLYNEGPDDKTVTFIEVGSFDHDYKVPPLRPELPALSKFTGRSFQQIIRAERRATAAALTQSGRPNGTIHLPAITPETVGALLWTFMTTTALMGELLDVNVYDQPGVEAGKKAMEEILQGGKT